MKPSAVLPMPPAVEPPAGAVPKNVYQLIADVIGDLSHDGISKDRKNAQQGYDFRGIDDVYNALAPILAKRGLIVLPRFLTRQCVERTSAKGTLQFFVTVEAEFDFVSSLDGSKHVVRTFGEAQDTADKATNKAMSAAYKYAAFQTFCIPTEGDNDADATTPEPTLPAKPDGYDDMALDLDTVALESMDKAREVFKAWPETHRTYFTTVDKSRFEKFMAAAKRKPA